ncbi:hypothetical protein ACOMHN_030228 [Nucella lapillus]
MGGFPSSPRRSRKQVKGLKDSFLLLSTKIEKRLPWISLARNGAAVLLLVSTMFLLTAVSRSLWPPGGTVAGVVLILALLLHLTSFILREWLVDETNSLLEAFYNAVPDYMDTSSMQNVKGDGWLTYTRLILLEVVSLLICFLFEEAVFVTEVFFAFIFMVPWVTLCRNGGAAISILGAGNLLVKSVSLYSQGREVAAQLILVGILLTLLGFFLRERMLISEINRVFKRFYSDGNLRWETSREPKQQTDTLYLSLLVLFHCISYHQCFTRVDGFNIWPLLCSVVLLIANGCYLWARVIQDKVKRTRGMRILSPGDIEIAHRVGKPGGAKPRPIIARFFSRRLRGRVLADRQKLKQSGVSVGEDLTQRNYQLLKRATEHSATMVF